MIISVNITNNCIRMYVLAHQLSQLPDGINFRSVKIWDWTRYHRLYDAYD